MIAEILNSKLFGITLSLAAFYLAVNLNKKLKSPLINPLLIAIAIVIIVLVVFHIPLESYNNGGDVISLFLAPATAVLAYSIYRQIALLKKNLIPILAGCLVGAITSISSVVILCYFFHLEDKITAALLPKSVTTPIAMEISSQLGGIVAVTVAAVVVTGILGAIFAPFFIKILHIENKIAVGVAIGSSSHAVGTSKAIEIGEIEGAMSGIAIGVSGIITVLISLFF